MKKKYKKRVRIDLIKYSYCVFVIVLLFLIGGLIFYNHYLNKKDDMDEKMYNREIKESVVLEDEEVSPNENGDIMVVMYHSIARTTNHYEWHRTKSEFIQDINYMYTHDYVLISMAEYLSGNIDIPKGKTPILITFDDGIKSCYSLVENEEGKLVVNSDTLVGILENFKNKHPDFGTGGVLYLTKQPFDNDAFYNNASQGSYEDRLRYLLSLGYEIGNHTYSHNKMNSMNYKTIESEIGKLNNMVYDLTGKKTIYLAYPYGITPNKNYMKAVRDGEYKGISYNIQSAVLAGPEEPYFTNPLNNDFDVYNISRTIAGSGDIMDMYWYFKYYKENPDKKYVSDGNPGVLTIKKENKGKLNIEKIKNLKVKYY